MTKKRFRRGLAALGILAAFFLALMVMLFAPSLASAEKNSGPGHQLADEPDANSGANSGGNGAPNPIYSEHSWQETEKVNWNGPPAGPCVDQSCAGGSGDDTQYFADAPSGGVVHSSNEPNGNGGPGSFGGTGGPGGQGNDAPHNGFAGGPGGGFPGGIFRGGNPQFAPGSINDDDADKCDSDDSKSGKDDTDKDTADKCESGDTDKDDSANSDNGNSGKGDGGQDDSGSYASDSQIFQNPNGPYELPPVDPQHFADTNPEIPPTDSTDDLPQQIPEPLTLSLFAVGLAGSVAMRRRAKLR
jgi:hypothetical protein